MKAERGQVALYLAMVLVAVMVLALMNVGAFLAVRAKNHAMNAGDAAALAAARRQGELLNEIGRLNLRHAEADYRELCKPPGERDWSESAEIVHRQRRIAFLGPLDCLRVANEAAKANGVSVLYDDIAVDNPAISLFYRHGFSEAYRTDAYILLRKALQSGIQI